MDLDIEHVLAAAGRIREHLLPTPVLESDWLSDRYGSNVVVLWESLQRTGSFKLRGALNKLLLLAGRGTRRVLAVSAGNHGLGVAWAARLLAMEATVVVPRSAAANKVAAIRRLGAAIEIGGETYDEAEAAARDLARARPGVEFVSPYNDVDVIAGQATATLDLLSAAPCDAIVVPAGGGGLLAGAAIAAAAAARPPVVFGAQPENAPALREAFRAGRRVVVEERPTLADGLSGNLEEGTVTLPLVLGRVRDVLLVREDGIRRAIREFAARDHQIVEGSGAVGAAAILEDRLPRGFGRVGVLVTGRNIDLETFAAAIAS